MSNGLLENCFDTLKGVFKSSRKDSPTMAPKKEVPSFIGKFFKTTSTARKLMDPEGRLCELNPNSHYRELVYSTVDADARKWDEMSWTQASLYEAAQKGMTTIDIRVDLLSIIPMRNIDPTMRVSRKKIDGRHLEILQRHTFNEPELEQYADKPNMDAPLAAITLGYAQAKRAYVYIISRKATE